MDNRRSKNSRFDFSATSRTRVVAVSITVTLACVVISLLLTDLGIVPVDPARMDQQRIVNIVAPIVIAFPVIFFLMTKLRELALAHERLTVYASTDGLTRIMNRAAFSTLVDAYLGEVRAHAAHARGALLIVDADNFKAINDRYGHDNGDEALILIAQTMYRTVAAPDIVGRLGGEEFGVFLPGAGADQAQIVGERIRSLINEAPFAPGGTAHRLSVSIGGAVFDRAVSYSELFRCADEQLYAAKRAGRNCVTIGSAHPDALAA